MLKRRIFRRKGRRAVRQNVRRTSACKPVVTLQLEGKEIPENHLEYLEPGQKSSIDRAVLIKSAEGKRRKLFVKVTKWFPEQEVRATHESPIKYFTKPESIEVHKSVPKPESPGVKPVLMFKPLPKHEDIKLSNGAATYNMRGVEIKPENLREYLERLKGKPRK